MTEGLEQATFISILMFLFLIPTCEPFVWIFNSKFVFVSLAPIAGIFSGAVSPIFRGMMSRSVGENEQG